MKLHFAAITFLTMFAGACADVNDDSAVTSLSKSEQQSLCEEFVTTFCTHAADSSFCTKFATNPKCAEAVAANRVTTQCSDTAGTSVDTITVGAVRECATATDEASLVQKCLSNGGGCMFDVVEGN